MRFLLVGCEVLLRELADAVARAPHVIDVEFLPKGLHDLGGPRMRDKLQEAVDKAGASKYDAVLMGYALCGNGLHGLEAREVKIVLPRAHDCIALLMGSRAKYAQYFSEHSGVYFRSTGWLERGQGLEQLVQQETGVGMTLAAMIEKYGEDNGRYLYEELNRYRQNYRRLTFIETGLEADGRFEEQSRAEAVERGWDFDKIRGDLCLFHQLASGEWNAADFLVVEPGYRIVARYDESIMATERIPA